jgi:A/G-specific adenine glycosylase
VLSTAALFARRLLAWYDGAQRRLPWRVDDRSGRAPNPYHVLVSEAMLQQTQVATVIPYFNRFIERFPTLADLAAADEQDVLRLWQGLGYYTRARNLRAAARAVASEYGGELPRRRDDLLKLPGVGRYTAGAVASIAFDTRAPILDGNVARVLCRVDRIETDPRERATQDLLWRRAEQILPRKRVGAFNTALMELGATVCIPRSPQCLICPVRRHCEAHAAGV